MKGFEVREFDREQVIFREGSKGDRAYLLQEGHVEISTSFGGRRKVLAKLQPITMFGEMAIFLDDQVRTATATAKTHVSLVEITRSKFDEFLTQSPVVISSLVEILVQRLKTATRKSLQVPAVHEIMAQTLQLLNSSGVREVPLARLLATVCSISSQDQQSVQKVINKLVEEGFIVRRIGQDGKNMIQTSLPSKGNQGIGNAESVQWEQHK